MKERRLLRCRRCHETFSYLIQMPPATAEQNLIVKVACPFCKAKLKIDLGAYRRAEVEVYRQSAESQQTGFGFALPDEMPTQLDE